MAEIRKHNPQVKDQIDAAILAALGEDVRPVPPGREAPRLSKPVAKPKLDPVTVPVALPTGWVPLDPAAVAKPLGAKEAAPAAGADGDDEAAEPDD